MNLRPLSAALLPLLLLTAAVNGASVRAVRASRALKVDGVLEADEWKSAVQITGFTQFEPQRGEPAREATEVLILYDDRYVYFGFRCLDSHPNSITAQLNRRDDSLIEDDSVIILLDTFHDRRSAYLFVTNPLGTQHDGRITDNGKTVDSSWDGSWLSAAQRSDSGWTAEIAIPFSSVRFKPGRDQTWGINLGRTCRRLLETSFWSGPLDSLFRVSQAGALEGLDLESAQRKYTVVPYVVAHAQEGQDFRQTAGLDIRYSLTPQDVAAATINPDFATVEADQEEINLTRFELNLKEKRQFFLEGAEQYRQRIPIFYSRRISDIRYGAKFLGQRGPWQYSSLFAESDPMLASPGSELEAPARYSVTRVERGLFKSSSVALMAANRSLDGINQGAVGLDSTLYFSRFVNFTGQLVRSHGQERGGHWGWYVRPSYDSPTGHVHFRYTHLGDRFADHVNAIGFIRDDNRREMDSAVEKQFWFRTGLLEKIVYESNYNIYWSQKNELRSWQIDEGLNFEFRNRWSASATHTSEYKLFEKDFHNRSDGFVLGYNTREWQSAAVKYSFGRNFDSDFRLAGLSFRRKLTPESSFEYELSRLWLDPDPGRSATIIHALRGSYNFTTDLFLRAFFQTNSVIDRRNLQVLFVWRYRPPFGSLQFAFQRGTAAFGQPSDQGNTVFIKFAYVL